MFAYRNIYYTCIRIIELLVRVAVTIINHGDMINQRNPSPSHRG